MGTTKRSFNRGLDKDVIHTYNGILVIRKDEIRPFVKTWTDLENTMLREMSYKKKLRTTLFYSYVGYKTESKN